MTFKSGQSGNPNGRPKGAVSRRLQLAKLLEPHAEALVGQMIALALDGDVNALRLCIERLLPKTRHAPIAIELAYPITTEQATQANQQILQAALEGKINALEANGLIELLNNQIRQQPRTQPVELPIDPNEAMRVYQRIMNGEY